MVLAQKLIELGSQGKPLYILRLGRVMQVPLTSITLWFKNGRYNLVTSDGEVELADCYDNPLDVYQRLRNDIESTIKVLTEQNLEQKESIK